jgi:hypothetical protein
MEARARRATERGDDRRDGLPRWNDPRDVRDRQGVRRSSKEHGASGLLDEIVGAKHEIDDTCYRSFEELKQHGLRHLRDAVHLLERKATPEEVQDYGRFVLMLADKVASAHREGGAAISDGERAAIDQIEANLAASGQPMSIPRARPA